MKHKHETVEEANALWTRYFTNFLKPFKLHDQKLVIYYNVTNVKFFELLNKSFAVNKGNILKPIHRQYVTNVNLR